VETLRNFVSFLCVPVFYVIDWLLEDGEYDQLIAEQHARNVARSFDEND
jgi:hypothetical protein